jgi:hypothetical protein
MNEFWLGYSRQYTTEIAKSLEAWLLCSSPLRVKSGKAQPEQMFSASPPNRRHEDQRCGRVGEDRDQDHLTGQLMSGMVSAGSSTVMTLSTPVEDLAMVAENEAATRSARASAFPPTAAGRRTF